MRIKFLRLTITKLAVATLTMTMLASTAHAAMEVQTTRIGHGVKAWYAESSHVPVVHIQLTFEGAGYASDPAGKEGRAAFAAAMLTEGAGDLDALAFQRALDDGALQLTAETSEDRLTIDLHALRDQAKRGGELLALALAKPKLATSDMVRMKTALLSRIAQLGESPDYQAKRLFDTHVFAGHPYANPPYGTAASIPTITAEDVKQYLTTYVTRGNVMISAAGDVDSSLLDDILNPVVEALNDGDAAPTMAEVNWKKQGMPLRQTMEVPQTVVQFAAPTIARDDPKFYAAYLANHILGDNGLVSRLAVKIRQEKGLVYGIQTYLDILRGIPLLRGNFATRNATAEEAVSEVKRTIAELRDKGATTQECADAKAHVIGSNILRLDSSQQIASALTMIQVNRLGEDYLEKRDSLFGDVSCDAINAAARDILDPEKFIFVMVGGSAPAASAP